MRNLLKFLKKYTLHLIIAMVMLGVQAYIELSLPTYTSNIINVGIQQSGIESGIPEVISEDTLDNLIIVSGNDKLINYYDVLEKTSDNLKDYPKLKDEVIYIRNDKEMDKSLEEEFNKYSLMVYTLSLDNEMTDNLKSSLKVLVPNEIVSDDVSIFTLLKYVPGDVSSKILEPFNEQIDKMPESSILQSSTVFVRNEYSNIGVNIEDIQNGYIINTGVKMLGIAFIAMLCSVVVGFLGARVAAFVARDMRNTVYDKVMKFSNAEYNDFSTASLITRTTNDIQRVSMLIVLVLRVVVFAPIMGIGGVIRIMGTNTSMTWIVALAVFSVITLVTLLFIIVIPKFKIIQDVIDKLNLVAREILNGIPVIRTFGTSKQEEKRFDKINDELTRISKFCDYAMSLMHPAIMLITNLVSVLIVWYGAKGIDAGTMQVGDMMAFLQYAMHIVMSFLMISMFAIMIPRASVSIKRIDEVLRKKISINDPLNPKEFDNSKKGLIEFKDVSFKYSDSDEYVLKDINFTAKPGEVTAIIGSTGSGKSTLVQLIPRLFDVSSGSISISGVDVKDVLQKDLRSKIGFVPQKGVLFSGTIESNVKYGNEELTDEKFKKILDIAQASEFVYEMEDKEKSEIAQGGTNVSGGQKQRLSIARALAINPYIYIFDDSFSALDFKTDRALRKALNEEVKDSTFIIVAQRISTIMNAEQIIVLDEGKIVGLGKHEDLLKNCLVYKQIAESQLSKEELYHE